MPAEKGIFLDVLPRFDMAAMGAILNTVEGMFRKSGAAMGATFGTEAQAKIAALAEEERKAANITEDAELRKTRAVHATEIAEQQAAIATERRILAETRYQQLAVSTLATENSLAAAKLRVEAATTAEARAQYAASDAALAQTARTRDLATATTLSAAAHDRHSEALAASAVTAGNAGRAFNLAGIAMTGAFVVGTAETVKSASNFEVAQTRIQVATQESAADIKKLHDGVLVLGPQIGQTAQDLENASFILSKGGFKDANDQLQILKSGGQLARVELAPLDETMKGLTTTLTDFGLQGKDAPQVVSQLQVALGNAKVPMDEFMGSLHNVEPVFKMLTGGDPAKAANGIAQVTTALARMTENGTSADQASQNIRNSILSLSDLGNNPKASQALGQLGLNGATLSHELTDPAVGYLGVLDKIHEAINSKLGPDGKILENALYQNPQAAQDLITQYDQLDDAHKKMADAIQNGTIPSLKALHLTEAEGQQGDFLKQWDKARQVVEGFNPILAKHGDLMRNALQMWKDSTGTTQGLLVASQLFGSDEAANKTKSEFQQNLNAQPDKDGNIQGWGDVMNTLKFKTDAANASLKSMAIQVGEYLIPMVKTAADVLADVFGWMNKNADVAKVLMTVIGSLGGAWLLFKTIAIGGAMWETIAVGVGTVITKVGALKDLFFSLGPVAQISAATVEEANAGIITSEEAVAASAAETRAAVASVGTAALGAAGAVAALGYAAYQAQQYLGDKDLGNKTKDDVDKPGIPWYQSLWNTALTWMGDDPAKVNPDYAKSNDDGKLPMAGPGTDGKGLGAANPERRAGVPAYALPPGAAAGIPGLPPGMPDYSGAMPGGLGLNGSEGGAGSVGAPPVGTRNDPIYIDPQSITDGLNDSDMGAQGQVGSGLVDIFQKSVGEGGFTLKNIATLMGTFVANLALGNPAGKLATGQFGGDDGGDLSGDIARIENMTPTERIEQENTIKMQKGLRAYKKALRSYAKAVQKYGPNSDQALDAEDSVLSARDSIDQTMINQQQSGGTAAQAYADDLAKGIDRTNPGKFAKDQAAAGAYNGSVPAGGGAEAWRGTVAATVDKYAAQMGIPDSKKGEWVDAIVSQIGTESGGNAGADNPHDSNGQGGIQHVSGLLQYLPSSYANSGGKLTGLPYMDPVGQIAGALFAPRNAAGDPTGIGHGVGWGPVDRPILPAPAGPTAGDRAAAANPTSLNDVLFGGGQGPIFKRSPVDPNSGNPNKGQSAASSAAENSAEAQANLARMRSDPTWYPGKPEPKSTNLFAPGGVLGGAPGPIAPQIAGPGLGASATAGLNAVNGVRPGAASPNGAPNGSPNGIGQPASPGVQSSQPKGGSGQGGVGLSQGIMSMASTALGALPGGQAAAIGLQEANRAAQYIGQAIGIGASGLLETFTIHGPNGEGGNGGWFGKLAGGLAGAHKSSPNTAGAAPGLDPQSKQPAAPLKPGEQPPPGGPKQGDPNSPGPGNGNNTINIQEQHIHHDDGGAQNRDAMRQLIAFQ